MQSRHEIGIGAGPVYFAPLAFFGDEFNGGFGATVQGKIPGSIFFQNQPLPPFTFFLDTGFIFTGQSLSSKSSGTMTTFSVTAGPGLLYPLHRYLQPVISVQAGLFYNRLTLGARGETYNAFNPAIRLHAGALTALTTTLFVESRVALPFYYLGEQNLYGPEYSVSVNYLLKPAEIIMTRAEKLFGEGKVLYEQKNFTDADAKFAEVLKNDAKHAGALNYRRQIQAHDQLSKARQLRDRQETWAALSQYQQAASVLSEVNEELKEYRSTMIATVPAMVQEGIRQYEEKLYADAERTMEHVLLIAPENEQAQIYLPRARSRRKAMEKLQ